MTLAELALGTYRTYGVVAAARTAIEQGVRWIDTAPNYQYGTAEKLLFPVLERFPSVRVSTKVGLLDETRQAKASAAGVLTSSRLGKKFSLDPLYIAWQARMSWTDLGRTPDVTFIHNPEIDEPSEKELDDRILRAFEALEECCAQGLTKSYGVATWRGLHDGSITIDRLLELAFKAGGGSNRFAAIQLPLSLIHPKPIADALENRGVLIDAQAAQVEVFASAPLHGGELLDIVTPEVARAVLPETHPLRVVLGTVAATPGVTRVLLSASTYKHWKAAYRYARALPPFDPSDLRKIVDAFRS
ncbi:aldo/keto reductase [Streptomyces sp. NPDC014734]|uniref:aldo/keto reductase n=1 Tax=Streptomyces sp. NPDC014734 TaxID=3364886 RepID=UPI0037015E95